MSVKETRIAMALSGGDTVRNRSNKGSTIIVAEPTFSRAAFYKPEDVLARRYALVSDSGPRIVAPTGPLLYMRLIPQTELAPLTQYQAMEVARNGILQPFGRIYGGFGYSPNKYGAIAYEATDDRANPEFSCLSQLFKNSREIWGIDFVLIHSQISRQRAKDTDVKYIPTGYIEEVTQGILTNYLLLAHKFLDYEFPIGLEVGIVGITGFRLALPSGIGYGGRTPMIYDDEIVDRREIKSPITDVKSILNPFYNKLWEEAGLKRPSSM